MRVIGSFLHELGCIISNISSTKSESYALNDDRKTIVYTNMSMSPDVIRTRLVAYRLVIKWLLRAAVICAWHELRFAEIVASDQGRFCTG